MKIKQLHIVIAFTLLGIVGVSWNARAQSCHNNNVLAAATSSAANFQVSCPAGTDYLTARVNLQAGAEAGQSVRLQIQKAGFVSSPVVVDATNGASFDAMPTCSLPSGTVPSAWTSLNPSVQKAGELGSGVYNILITKTGNAALRYGYSFACVQSQALGFTPVQPNLQVHVEEKTKINSLSLCPHDCFGVPTPNHKVVNGVCKKC